MKTLLAGRKRSPGFGLVELMVAMAVGLLLVAGMGAIFVNAARSNRALADMNQQMENGRFALQLLRENLQHAGFWGELGMLPAASELTNPVLVDPCTAYTSWTAADRVNALVMAVQGYSHNTVNAGVLPGGCTLPHWKPGTDVLVVRQVDTCTPGTTDCPAGQLGLQVSLCALDASPRVMEATSASPSPFTLRRPDTGGRQCTNPSYVASLAPVRRVRSNLYYVRSHASTVGDGIPTLMRMEPDGAGAQPIVEGIDVLRLEYGVDNAGNDGAPDVYVTDTTTLNTNTNPASWGADNWSNVMMVKVHLVARSLQATPGYDGGKTFALPGGNVSIASTDNFKRHAYQAAIRLTNPAARRAP